MSAHADFLDQNDRLSKPFWVSLTMHGLILGGLAASAIIQPHHLNMGSVTGGGMGALMVNPVSTIPLPNRGGRENPVANDTKSQVPTPPAPPAVKARAKPAPKPKAPPVDAIPLHSERARVRHHEEVRPQPQAETESPAAAQPNRFREHQTFNPSQLYSSAGQQASSEMYQVPGGGGVGLGDKSPFGEQFGAYANIIRNNIAQNWKPVKSGLSQAVVVTFTIRRDGSIANVKILTSSGNQSLDFSAQRAVLDAQLPPLPYNFPRNQADVQMKFELGN